MYYRGNLVFARHNTHTPNAREIIELADAARALGTPQLYEMMINKNLSHARRLGKGLAHLAQRRLEEDKYEYWITKAREVVVE